VAALAAVRIHEFASVVQPLEIKGGTGSTLAPMRSVSVEGRQRAA
jgi:hypothetical protein